MDVGNEESEMINELSKGNGRKERTGRGDGGWLGRGEGVDEEKGKEGKRWWRGEVGTRREGAQVSMKEIKRRDSKLSFSCSADL